MKCVLITPDTLIQPRAISSTHSAYVSSDSPRPSYSSGIISPKMPSSLRPSTISVGYSSLCSSSLATGMIFSSTNCRTALRISVWSSERPSVWQRRGMRLESLSYQSFTPAGAEPETVVTSSRIRPGVRESSACDPPA